VLADYVRRYYALDVDVRAPIALEDVDITERENPHSGQRQLLTTDILSWMQGELPDDAFGMIAITMIDLYPDPRWNFVFGQASLRERVGVYSFARYDPAFYAHGAAIERPTDEETDDETDREHLVLRRSLKVMAHELGHMFGMAHCPWFECAMNGSNHLEEADGRPMHLCPVDLRKLVWNVELDPVARYEALVEFYDTHGFDEEAAWTRERLRFLTDPDL